MSRETDLEYLIECVTVYRATWLNISIKYLRLLEAIGQEPTDRLVEAVSAMDKIDRILEEQSRDRINLREPSPINGLIRGELEVDTSQPNKGFYYSAPLKSHNKHYVE